MPATAPTVTVALAKHKASQSILAIHFTAKTVAETGVFLPRADATPSPTLSIQSSAVKAPGAEYRAIMLDPNAPFPSLPILGPIIHGIRTDLMHRYVFLLYVQSVVSDAEGTKKKLALPETIGVMQRVKWDQGTCEKKLELGEFVASNYFTSK